MTVANTTSAIHALSPLDGRYRDRVEELAQVFSEAGLIKARLQVEASWLLHLQVMLGAKFGLEFNPGVSDTLKMFAKGQIGEESVIAIKRRESQTNHDVKAVEYYLQEHLASKGASTAQQAFVHFACTSEDINNLAYALMLKKTRDVILLPLLNELFSALLLGIKRYKGIAMLSRTHGQAATPTTMGKEWAVFGYRVKKQIEAIASTPIVGKFNGAVGNYSAHYAAIATEDWPEIARSFVEIPMSLSFNPLTTQIESHDSLILLTNHIQLLNTILIGFCRDIWTYISLGYFNQSTKAGEVGSSTMPHKVNPIDFENAEGNLGVANALAAHFAEKLPISRMQRDLSDSTVQRSVGTFLGYSIVAYKSLLKGIGKLQINEPQLAADLNGAFEVLAEAVQSAMRVHGVGDAYDQLKTLTRGKAISHNAITQIIQNCQSLPEAEKSRLIALTPATYLGCAEGLCDEFLENHGG